MKYSKLGSSDLYVSEICLGTMTWGSQNTEAEAHEQMDYAIDEGVNFFDTAELYPTTPVSAETQGDTERFIGSWFKKSGKRDKVVLASKIAGQGRKYIRGGVPISPKEIDVALDMSLERLGVDCIDLYQLHWPNREVPAFRGNWGYDPSNSNSQKEVDDFLAILQTLDKHRKAGKIREFGVSNDTAWGIMKLVELAKIHDLPRVVSVQNEYSLLDRKFDTDLAEISHHEGVGLLAYTPLAAGILTGKYQDGNRPGGSRATINSDLGGRLSRDYWIEPVRAYLDIAQKYGLDPAAMALAFCLTRPFMGSVIIGATTMEQLKTDISAKDVVLTPEILEEINETHRKYPLPI